MQMLGMEPKARERFSGNRLRLRDFVLVMRKNKVDTTRMNIESLAEVAHRHCGALNVPSRPSRSERRFPERLIIPASLPEDKIARILLVVFVDIHPGAAPNAAEIIVRKLAVIGKCGNPIVG